MRDHTETLRGLLARGPLPPRQLLEKMGISQPTLSRTLSQLGDELIRIGAARSIRYALRDSSGG